MSTGQRTGLSEMDVLKLTIPQTEVNCFLAEVIQWHLGLGANVLQFDFSRDVQPQLIDEHAQNVRQDLRREANDLERQVTA